MYTQEEMGNSYRNVVLQPGELCRFEKLERKCEDDIKTGCRSVGWIYLGHDKGPVAVLYLVV